MELSVIVVSYNTKDDLKNCLSSIYEQTHDLEFEVIVVDNASSDSSPAMVKALFPQAKLIQLNANLGFGTANNAGAKLATGKYLLFLNPDTLLFNNSLKLSLDQAKSLPVFGVLGIRLLFADKSIQPSGGYFPNFTRLLAWQLFIDDLPFLKNLIKPIHPDVSFFKHSFSPDWIMGAFLLTQKDTFKQTGGFDEKIFMYGEELELCYRIKKLKLKAYYLEHPSIIHLQAKSSSSHFALVNEVKGIKYFFQKHFPATYQPFVKIIFKIGALLRLVKNYQAYAEILKN